MPFYAPNFGKIGRASCLWLDCLCVGVGVGWVFAGWAICQWGCVQRCSWLAGSVGHFFETLNGEC